MAESVDVWVGGRVNISPTSTFLAPGKVRHLLATVAVGTTAAKTDAPALDREAVHYGIGDKRNDVEAVVDKLPRQALAKLARSRSASLPTSCSGSLRLGVAANANAAAWLTRRETVLSWLHCGSQRLGD